MTRRTKSHLLYLIIDAASIWLLWEAGVALSKIWRLDTNSVTDIEYGTWASWSVLVAPVLFIHIMSVFELFGVHEHSKRLWKWVLRSVTVLSVLTLLSGIAVHYATLAHLESIGYVNCAALERHGRIVVNRTFMRAPLPAKCAVETGH